MEKILLEALEQYLLGKVAHHKANIHVYLQNSTGIGEHPDIIESMEQELGKLADADEKLSTLKKFFND